MLQTPGKGKGKGHPYTGTEALYKGHLRPRLKKGYNYTSTPPLGHDDLF